MASMQVIVWRCRRATKPCTAAQRVSRMLPDKRKSADIVEAAGLRNALIITSAKDVPGRMPASLKTASLLASPEAPPAAQKSNWCTYKCSNRTNVSTSLVRASASFTDVIHYTPVLLQALERLGTPWRRELRRSMFAPVTPHVLLLMIWKSFQ